MAFAFAGVMLVTACDTDEPAAPKRVAVPTEPSQALSPLKSGNLLIKVVDQNQNLITAGPVTGFKVTGPNNNSWIEWDENNNDWASGMGIILRKNLAPGTYKYCQIYPPGDYGVVGLSCKTATVYVGATSGIVFTDAPATHIKFIVTDPTQKLIAGATFTLDSSNVQLTGVTDNGVADEDLTAGKLDVKLRFESTYKLCVDKAPFSYIWTPNQVICVEMPIKMGMGNVDFGNWGVVKQFSVSWQVTDGTIDPSGQYTLIGPSTYGIWFNGNFITNFDDNGNADDDPTLGKVALTLPFAGDYQICETVPPAGHWLPQSPCKQFTLTSGVPVSLGNFVNPEAQVYKP